MIDVWRSRDALLLMNHESPLAYALSELRRKSESLIKDRARHVAR